MTYNTLNIEDILHEYEQTRLNNKRLLQERRDKIYSEIPRISEIDSTAAASYLQAARLRVMGQDTDKTHTQTTKSANRILTAEKHQLLVNAGYPADYLEPIYNCPICQDTGYVNQQKCSCFVNRIVDALYLQSNLKNILAKENFNTFSLEYYSKEILADKQYSPYENISNIP